MTASKRFAKCVAMCRANFEKNSELVARKTKRRMWDPRTPGMNYPVHADGTLANYFDILWRSANEAGFPCSDVNPNNAQKLRWCELVETRKVNDINCYVATALGVEYVNAAHALFLAER